MSNPNKDQQIAKQSTSKATEPVTSTSSSFVSPSNALVEDVASNKDNQPHGNDVENWRNADVMTWIRSLSFGKDSEEKEESKKEEICKIFEENDVNGEVLLGLTEENLKKEYKIKSIGLRTILLKRIAMLKKPDSEILSIEQKMGELANLVTLKNTEDLRKPSKPKDFTFKYHSRQDEKSSFKEVAYLNVRAHHRKTKDPKEWYFTIISGASGSGKTCTACEIGTTLRSEKWRKFDQYNFEETHNPSKIGYFTELNLRCFENTCEIYVDFSNGDRVYDDYEKDYDQLLGSRLFCRCLRQQSFELFRNVKGSKFLKSCFRRGLFQTNVVLQLIGEQLKKTFGQENPIPIVIILDEYQTLKGTFPDGDNWKKVSRILGSAMVRRDADLLILPVIAGTFFDLEMKFEQTTYGNNSIRMTTLAYSFAEQILQEKLNINSLITEFPQVRRFLYLIHMFPKLLQLMAQSPKLLELTSQISRSNKPLFNLDACFDTVLDEFDNLYRDKMLDIFIIGNSELTSAGKTTLFYSLTGTSVSGDAFEILRPLIDKGYIGLDTNSRIIVPLPIFRKIAQPRYSGMSEVLFPPLSRELTGLNFEEMCLKILSIKISGWSENLKKSTMTLSNLFPGAYIHRSLQRQSIVCQHANYVTEKNPYITDNENTSIRRFNFKIVKSTKIETTELTKEIESSDFCDYIFRASKNQRHVDARLFAINEDIKQKNFMFLISFTKEESADKDDHNKIDYKHLKIYPELMSADIEKLYSEYKVVFVLITSKIVYTQQERNAYLNDNVSSLPNSLLNCLNLIVIDSSCLEMAFSPNILPYFVSIFPSERTQVSTYSPR